jgi:hypothetical protein
MGSSVSSKNILEDVMKIAYNSKHQVLTYLFGDTAGHFKISRPSIADLLPNLEVDSCSMLEISGEIFNKLTAVSRMENTSCIGGYYFERDGNPEFVMKAIKAYESDNPVLIVYKDGDIETGFVDCAGSKRKFLVFKPNQYFGVTECKKIAFNAIEDIQVYE